MTQEKPLSPPAAENNPPADEKTPAAQNPAVEIGGRKGLDPTRYGDWENGGKCVDF